MRSLFFLLCSTFFVPFLFAQSNNFDATAWVTNKTINSIVSDGSTVYLGGEFTLVGPSVPFGIPLDTTTRLPNMAFPVPNATIRVVVPDGSGGWYIGGDFTSIGGVTRNRLARINSDGSLHAWDPNASGIVNTMAVSGSRVYVGGTFSGANSINGNTTRNRLAAVDTGSGVVTSWNPNASGTVNTLAVSGSRVYVGGAFNGTNSINGNTSRNRLAAVDTITGTVTSWNPNASGAVNTLAVSGSKVYVGGLFNGATSINGNSPRNRLAAVDTGTGTVTAWNPNATSGTVNVIVVDGSTIYVGGTFTNVGGSARNRIAALDANTNTSNATTWNPNSDDEVNTLMIVGTRIYVGGKFQNIGGQARPCIAELDATGSASSWNLKAGNIVRAFAEYSGTIYAGGDFTIIGGELRNRLAAIDATTGQANAWNPNANNTVSALLMSGGVLYAGGSFTTIGGVTRNRIAAIDPATAALRTWDPSASSDVVSLAASGDTIYAGGNFTTIGGQTRNRLAALSASTGLATAFNANVSGKVNAIAVSGGKVYFGGQFTGANAVNGNTTRNYLASVSTADGTVNPWDPNTNDQVFAVAVYNGVVYVAGDCSTFTPPGSTLTTRAKLAALDPITAIPTAWNPSPSSTISTMAFSGSMVYVGRGFASIGGSTRNNAAGVYLNLNSANATPWYPTPESYVLSIAVGSNKVFIAGSFNKVDGVSRSYFAAYPITSVSWGGSAGGNFSEAANWAPGIAPSDTMDVSIPHGSPILDADYTIPTGKTLTVSGTGTMSVAAGKTLTIAGTADFGGKSVTLRSTSAGTAAIGQVSGTLTNATNVTVQRYLPAGRKWRMLGAPLTGSSNNSIFSNWQNNDVPNGSTGVEIWGPGGTANPSSSNTGLALGLGSSMRSYDAGWQNVTNTNTSLLFDGTTNIGYALFQTGPYNNGSTAYIGGAGNIPAAASTTLSATGSLISGMHTKTFTAASAGQYFLVANPYASPLDPASFTDAGTVNRSNLDNTLYMWDAKPGGTNGLGRYVSYDIIAAQYSSIGAGTGFTAHTTPIQSGQAFFVRATSAGAASLTFRETSKGGVGSHDMLGDALAVAPPALRFQLRQDSVHYDGAVAFFHAGASRSIDKLDGSKIMNGSDNLGFLRDGKTLVFEHHPEPTVTDTLFLKLGQMRQESFRLCIEGDGLKLPDGMDATLVDRFTGTKTPIDVSRRVEVDFSVSSDSASTGGRFMVLFNKKPASGVLLQEPPINGQVRIFPNPVSGVSSVSVSLDASAAPWDIRMVDLHGRTIWQRSNISEAKLEIPVSGFGKGLYHLIASDKSGMRIVSDMVKQ